MFPLTSSPNLKLELQYEYTDDYDVDGERVDQLPGFGDQELFSSLLQKR